MVEVLDLSPGRASGDRSSRPTWLGRAALGVVAVALLAGGVVLAQGGDEPGTGDDGDLAPLAIGPLGAREMAADGASLLWGGEVYELATDLPDLGSSAPVYQLVRPERSPEEWVALAGALGISASEADVGPDGLVVVADGATRLDAYPQTGSWSVNVSPVVMTAEGAARSSGLAAENAAPADPVPAEGMPSAAEAEDQARALLGEAGVLADADWEVEVIEGMMGFAAVDCAVPADGAEVACPQDQPPTIESWSVQFHRVVDGVVTVGLDWTVVVGSGGRVDAVVGILANLEPLGDYPLRSTQAAYDELAARSAATSGPADGVGEPPVAGTAVPDIAPVDDLDDERVRVRPEGCASGIEPGYCAPDWCLTQPGEEACQEPCTDQSIECVPVSEAVVVCNGDPASACTQPFPTLPDGTPVTTIPECADRALVDRDGGTAGAEPPCVGADPCPDTVTVPDVPPEGRAPMVAPACIDPGVVCADSAVEVAEDGVTSSTYLMPTCLAPPCDVVADPGCLPALCGDLVEVPEGDCTVDDPPPVDLPAPIDPMPPAEPLVITVTGVERTATVTWGSSDGAEVAYLVPSYRFVGTYPGGSEWWTEVVAVADDLVAPVGPIDPPTEPPATDPPPSEVPGTEPPSTEVPETEPPSPPTTEDVSTCSQEHPEACSGSVPTTAPPATVVCTPVTNPNGVTLPPAPECTAPGPVID